MGTTTERDESVTGDPATGAPLGDFASSLADDPYALPNPYEPRRRGARVRKARAPRAPRATATRDDLYTLPPEGVRRRRPAVRVLVIILVLAVCGAAGLFTLDALRPPDISAYADEGVSVAGLGETDFIVTPAELMELDCVRTKASGTGAGGQGQSKAGVVAAYGPLMEDFVAVYGHTLGDFSSIRVYCKDGYVAVLRPERLEGEPLLSVADDNDALLPYQRPLRLVIPGESTGKWAFGVLRIEFQ